MCCEWLRYRRLMFTSATSAIPVVDTGCAGYLIPSRPTDGRSPAGGGRPLMLEPGWVTDNHDRFDVFHVHFGFDAVAPDDLGKVTDELKLHDKPLVYTVHDLRNPHHIEPTAHDEAARRSRRRRAHADYADTGCGPADFSSLGSTMRVVLPHPHVLESARIDGLGPANPFVVAVHAKSVRANMDLPPVLDALVPVVAEATRAVLAGRRARRGLSA